MDPLAWEGKGVDQQTEEGCNIPGWARGDPLMEWYATEVWGRRVGDDDLLFEVMGLQVFQAGLSFRMVLARRDAFRRAFHGWRIAEVADMEPPDVDRLMGDASIIRNRRKIEACIANARIAQGIQREHGSLCNWFYNVLEGDDLAALQRTLRKTFRFMGPEIARMWLLASGRIPHGG
jgi:DNA-3-methyladenine glycosylase I